MGKQKPSRTAGAYKIDSYRIGVSVRPLFGLERLVRILRRHQSGILLCDNAKRISHAVAFSKTNARTEPFRLRFETSTAEVLGEPRINVPNEAPAEDIERFENYGRQFTFLTTPKKGSTHSLELDIYRPLESYRGGSFFQLLDDNCIATFLLTLDLSAYIESGYLIDSANCVFTPSPPAPKRGKAAAPTDRLLRAVKQDGGRYEWRVNGVNGAIARLAWMVEHDDPIRGFPSFDVGKLTTELSVNPILAKDLHNFVSTCQFYAADIRSLNAIDQQMVTSKTALWRSLDSIEHMIGAELIERSRGKGMIRITPVGEAVLEWWCRYYTRWTPIAPNAYAENLGPATHRR